MSSNNRRIAPGIDNDPFASERKSINQHNMMGGVDESRFRTEAKGVPSIEAQRLRQEISLNNESSMGDQTLQNQSVAFRRADGHSLDIGNGDDSINEDDEKSNSEEEREAVYGNDANNQLSYTKMMKMMDNIHVREKVYEEDGTVTLRKRSICGTKIGFHDCGSRDRRKSDLEEYGVGTVLYFQFIKYLGCLFMMMTILAIPSMLFFFYGSELEDKTFQKIVTAASLGNLGSSNPVCQTGFYDLSSTRAKQDPQVLLSLSCPFGELFSLYDFGQLSVNDKVDCSQTQDESTDLSESSFNFYPPDCHILNEDDELAFQGIQESFEEQCKGKQKCNFTFKQSNLPQNVCFSFGASPSNWQYLALAKCSSSTIQFGANEVKVTKNVIGIVVVFFDLLITFSFWCSMLALKKLQNAQESEIDGATVAAPDFTVMVSQEPHLESLDDLPGVYYAWAENICSQETNSEMKNQDTGFIDPNQNSVWNVQLGLTNLGYLDYMKAMGKLLVQKKKLDKKLRKMQTDGASDSSIASTKVKISQMQREAKAILKAGNEYKENNPASCRYSYIQFQSMNGKEKFLKAMDINGCKRCVLRCQNKGDAISHKYMAGKWPEVQIAPDPSLINWQNLGKGKIERCGRSTMTNILALILLSIGFFTITYLLNVKEQYNSNTAQCGSREVTPANAFLEYQNTDNFEGEEVTCFCLQEFKKIALEVGEYTFPDESTPCKAWLEDYNLNTFLGVLISLALSAINGILRFTLKKSSTFEGHHSVTLQLSSAFSKMWIIQFVNTAIILVVINNQLSSDGLIQRVLDTTGTNALLFNGKYSDFSQQWYSVVGITIFTTAFINGITPVSQLGKWCLFDCLRFLDRGCSSDKKKTKKIIQEEYEAIYTGQNIGYDERFSIIISMIWVIMMFSAAIPSLYIAGFVLCLVVYWTDKSLLLKFYKIPPRHGSTLAHKARNIIEWSLIVHLFMGLYMLSNPEIFTSEEDDNKALVFFQGYAKLVAVGISTLTGVDSTRFEQVHVVFYSVGIGIFLILFIIEKVSGTWSKIMSKLCCFCLYRDTEPELFSQDIYKDVSAEAQHKEYTEAKALQKTVSQRIQRDPNNEFSALRNYYKQRLTLKVKSIRYELLCALSLTKTEKGSLRDTKSAFFHLQKDENKAATSELFVERMRGLYSYNVLDSADYTQAKKIERRISRYDKKLRDKVAREAESQRIEALSRIQALSYAGGESMKSPTEKSLSQATFLRRQLTTKNDLV